MEVNVVEFLKTHTHGSRCFKPGTRCLAWKGPTGWIVTFNGVQIPVPVGTVAPTTDPKVLRAVESRATARDEEYQTAKT